MSFSTGRSIHFSASYLVSCAAIIAMGSLCGCTSGASDDTEHVAESRAALTPITKEPTKIDGRVWYGADTLPDLPGTSDYEEGHQEFTLISHGAGLGTAWAGVGGTRDSVRYVYTAWGEGDVEIVARVTSAWNSVPGTPATAGLMIREGNLGPDPSPTQVDLDPEDTMGGGWYGDTNAPDQCHPAPSHKGDIGAFEATSRANGALVRSPERGGTRVKPPVWLRLRRIGNDFSLARRREGGPWVPLPGGPFKPSSEGNVRVGFYVGRTWTAPGELATATFDNVYIGKPRLEYRTSWIASSHAKASTGIVSNGMDAFYVAPSGDSYKYFADGEGYYHRCLDKFSQKGGQPLPTGIPCFFGVLQGGLTGDGAKGDDERLYYFTEERPFQAPPRVSLQWVSASSPTDPNRKGVIDLHTDRVGGVAADANHVYVSDRKNGTNGRIRIFDRKGEEQSEISFSSGPPPGILTVDHNKRLWIARTADFPDAHTSNFKLNASTTVECWDPFPDDAGKACPTGDAGKIKKLNNPTALAIAPNVALPVSSTVPTVVDPQNDKLLVALNGEQTQNVYKCSNLDDGPVCTRTLGVAKGVFADPVPGLVSDPKTLGDATRFFSPIGVGVDSDGNTLVASSAPRVEVQKFSKLGVPIWGDSRPIGLSPEPGAFDPDTKSDGRDFYTLTRHFSLDLSANPLDAIPGSEWSSKSVIWNPFRADAPDDQRFHRALPSGDRGATFIRRLGPDNKRFMFARDAGMVRIYRFDKSGNGEIAVPCGSLDLAAPGGNTGNANMWIDVNADGIRNETTAPGISTRPRANEFEYAVDLEGTIWLAGRAFDGIWKIPLEVVNANGVPIYNLDNRTRYDLPGDLATSEGKTVRSVRFDAKTKTMYVYGEVRSNNAVWCGQGGTKPVIERFANFGTPLQTSQSFDLPEPIQTRNGGYDFGTLIWDEECGCGTPDCTCSSVSACDCNWWYRSFEIAGNYFFVQERYGTIHVHDADTGAEVTRFFAGPELSGYLSAVDYFDAISVVRRSNGEYLLATTDTSSDSRSFLYRWVPPAQITQTIGLPAGSRPRGVAVAPNGSVWVTLYGTNQIAKIDPSFPPTVTTSVQLPQVGSAKATPNSIVATPNGNIWFTETGTDQLGCVPQNADIKIENRFVHRSVGSGSRPRSITLGPDGNLWLTGFGNHTLIKVVPPSGGTCVGTVTTTTISQPPLNRPWGIAAGAGLLWFSEESGNRISSLSSSVSQFPIPGGPSGPSGIVVHPDGTPWFSMSPRNTVGKRLATGEFKEFGLGQDVLDPIGLTVDTARDVWVAAQQHIVVLSAEGQIKDTIPVPNGRLFGATATSTGEVWFTDEASNQVLRVSR